jgi:hypothetical protein
MARFAQHEYLRVMTTRFIPLVLIFVLLLTACDVTLGPPAVTGTLRISLPGDPVVVYRQPQLLAYPHAEVTRLDLRDDRSRVEFRSRATLAAVYQDLHLQLRAAGWERTTYRERRDRFEATYARGRGRLEVDLRDRGGRDADFRLDLRAR